MTDTAVMERTVEAEEQQTKSQGPNFTPEQSRELVGILVEAFDAEVNFGSKENLEWLEARNGPAPTERLRKMFLQGEE